MGFIMKLPQIIQNARQSYERGRTGGGAPSFICTEKAGVKGGQQGGASMLAQADNIDFMRYLLENGWEGKLKLIYIDPPFYSNANYKAAVRLGGKRDAAVKQKAYEDIWEHGMEEYLTMLCERLFYMKELLAEDGGIWVHLDWHAVHYVKVLMDEIFGEEHFINEVIWNYKSGGVNKRHFARKHDTLLYYAKTQGYFFQPQKEKSYNRGLKPYRFKGVEEFQDEIGWYTQVNRKDVWQVDMVGRTSGERTGYATQKPEALLEIILRSCTEEGDWCADFFCGSGTLAAAASRMGRRFIACDAGKLAFSHTYCRLLRSRQAFAVYSSSQSGFPGEKNGVQQLTGKLFYRYEEEKMQLQIYGFTPKELTDPTVQKKDATRLEQIRLRSPMKLLSFGSLGVLMDGIYHPYVFFEGCSDEGIVCLDGWNPEERQKLPQCGIVFDVFGNQSSITIQAEEGRYGFKKD